MEHSKFDPLLYWITLILVWGTFEKNEVSRGVMYLYITYPPVERTPTGGLRDWRHQYRPPQTVQGQEPLVNQHLNDYPCSAIQGRVLHAMRGNYRGNRSIPTHIKPLYTCSYNAYSIPITRSNFSKRALTLLL